MIIGFVSLLVVTFHQWLSKHRAATCLFISWSGAGGLQCSDPYEVGESRQISSNFDVINQLVYQVRSQDFYVIGTSHQHSANTWKHYISVISVYFWPFKDMQIQSFMFSLIRLRRARQRLRLRIATRSWRICILVESRQSQTIRSSLLKEFEPYVFAVESLKFHPRALQPVSTTTGWTWRIWAKNHWKNS